MKTYNTIPGVAINQKKLLTGYRIKKALVPWMFLAPGILITLLLRYYTIFNGIKLAFYKYDVANPPGFFVGLKNFSYMFKDPNYWQAWKNTFVFVILILLLNFFIPIIQALLLAEIGKLRNFFSTMYILPAVIPLTINVVLWRWIFDPSYGVANYIIELFGGKPQLWLSDINMVKFCIIIPGIIGGGVNVLLYLAAIMGISEDIKEASQLDGCTGFRRMFSITLPNIKFLILIQFVLSTLSGFQLLDLPYQFTGGGPGFSSTSMPIYIYKLAMVNFDYGKSSAAALTLMVIIAVITIVQMKLNNQERD